jgi:histidinol-phosphate aminotransferase
MNLDSLIRSAILQTSPKVASPAKKPQAIRLDKGEFPYPPSPQVIAAIQAAASGINRYPEILTPQLREALAVYNHVATDRIALANGSDDSIELVLKICLNPGDEVIVPVPSFFVYGAATAMLGGKTINVPRQPDFDLDIGAILGAVTDRTKIIFIANPNNPTANLTARENLVQLLEKVSCLVVVDECYFEICDRTLADLIDSYPHLIVIRSLSKSFGLAGIRVGYSIANPQLTDYIYRAAQIFPVDCLAIAAALTAIQDIAYAQAKLQEIIQQREYLAAAMTSMGLKVYPSATNFLFVSTAPTEIPAAEVVQNLAARDIYVADFSHKPGLDGYHFRVATGTPAENQLLVKALQQLL